MTQSSLIRPPFIGSPLHQAPATFRQFITHVRQYWPHLVMVTKQSNPEQPKIALTIEPEKITLQVKKRSGYHVYCYRDTIKLVTLDRVPADYHDLCSMVELIKWLVQRVQMGEGSVYLPCTAAEEPARVLGGVNLKGGNDIERMTISNQWLPLLKGEKPL